MNKILNSCKVSDTLPSDELVAKARGLGLPDTFYNYLLLSDNSEDSETFPWEREGAEDAETEDKKTNEVSTEEKKEMPKPTFGSGSGGAFNFGAKANTGGGFGGFGGVTSPSGGFGGFAANAAGGTNGGGFQFSLNGDGNNAFKNAGKSIFGKQPTNGNADDEGTNENEECTAEFAPVLSELPPEVQVTTGLEEDEEVFSHRAKLYRFARECTPPEWKERGLGDIKITKTKTQVIGRLTEGFGDLK